MTLTDITTTIAGLLPFLGRLGNVTSAYLLALMIEAPRHSQSLASSISGISQGQFSRLLNDHSDLAFQSLKQLGGHAAKMVAPSRTVLVNGATWTVAIIIDSTLHPRSSLKVENAQRFNHGGGFVIGHQITNIVLYLNGCVIPLPPIFFMSKTMCRKRGVPYKTEHEHISEYLEKLNLASYLGFYRDDEIVVLTDAGYDSRKVQLAILAKGWAFISALKSVRSAYGKWEARIGKKPKWRPVGDVFWVMRGPSPWTTVRITTDGGGRKEFRGRKLPGFIKGVSAPLTLVCSEKSKGRGRRFFACSKEHVSTGVVLRTYSLRWAVELFHRSVKDRLGLCDVSAWTFEAVESHVGWVYCAWLLLQIIEIPSATGFVDKQRRLTALVGRQPVIKELERIVAARYQFGGLARREELLLAALRTAMAA